MSVDRYSSYSTNVTTFNDMLSNMKSKKESKSEQEKEQNRSYIKKLLKVTVFLVNQKWGHCENLSEIAKLLGSLGDPVVSSMLAADVNYLSPRAATEFVELVSDFIERKTIAEMRDRKFTIFLDESTDNANRSQVSIMARWVGENGANEKFLGLVHINGTKALDFEEAVQTFCVSKELDVKNIRFIAADGCNTMSGERTGTLQSSDQIISCKKKFTN